MVRTCVVTGCKNRGVKGTGSFALFPKSEPKRTAWKKALKLQRPDVDGCPWEPPHYTYVCWAHFHSGKTSNNVKHPDYVPSLNLGYTNKELEVSIFSFHA